MDGEFFIPCGDAQKLFHAIKEALDQITRLVAMLVVAAWRSSVGSGWNDRLRVRGYHPLHQGITVVALVRQHRSGLRRLVQQRPRLRDVSLLGAGQGEPQGVAERIDTAVDFGSEPATRAAQSLWAVFFLAPVACWWARIAVLSSITSSRSRSALMAANNRSNTPALVQRENRVNVVCQLPSSAGISRHGAPVRPIHSTASRNNRLSFAVTPQSPALPGNWSLIRSHWSSRNIFRFMSPTPSISWTSSLNLIVNTA